MSTIPATPKIRNVSLPPSSPTDDHDSKILGGSRRRLASLFGKAPKMSKAGVSVSRSTTPAPAPVAQYDYPRHSRPRASSMTNSRPLAMPDPVLKPALYAPIYLEPRRGGSSNCRTYPTTSMPQSTSWVSGGGRPVAVAPGKHEGADTPKYMKAKVKEVAIKDESIVLSWPLVPYNDRRNAKYPLLYYDVAFDPRDANNIKDNRKTHFLALPEEDRELPVSTHCTVTEMVIDCPLVGSLVVARPEGLRCIDVFFAIYSKYQRKPRSHEMPANKEKYMRAFEQRCRDCPGLAEYNRTKIGFLRVDLLKGERIFEGLRRAKGDRWELLIDTRTLCKA